MTDNGNIPDSDNFSWYNAEITRYRNIEWKVAGYSIAFSYATLLFAIRAEPTAFAPDPKTLAVIVTVLVVVLIAAAIHVHSRLNDFRAKRDSLERGERDHKTKTGKLFAGVRTWDIWYLFGFLLVPIFMGWIVVTTLLG